MQTSTKNLSKTLKSLKGLHFLPLGGAGEIGMNANFYFFDGQWLMVDNGITFSRTPDAILMTDISSFINAIDVKTLQAIVISHAHEDHIGAVAYLWPYLRCPIYATPFAIYILRNKLKEAGIHDATVIEIPLGGGMQIGVFNVQFLSLTHSIPEPNGIVIKTAAGTIVHTADWKIDLNPLVGGDFDQEKLIQLGNDGVLALMCDSTNVFESGTSGSEEEVFLNLDKAIAKCEERVIVSCFSSNIARIKSCYLAAIKNGRKVCIIGRSLLKMIEAARHCGYIGPEICFSSIEEMRKLPVSRQLIITTGSQAEPNAALTRMAKGSHPFFTLKAGDMVIFSSRVIPGNDIAIAALQNRLVRLGVSMATCKDGLHVSGHPYRDELIQMYKWLKPNIAIPVHGEDLHIYEHALLAKECGVKQAIRAHNGQLFRLDPEKVEMVCEVPTGRLYLDGRRLISSCGAVVTQRKQLLEKGYLCVIITISRAVRKIIGRQILAYGVFEDHDEQLKIEALIKRSITDVFHEVSLYGDKSFNNRNEEESVPIQTSTKLPEIAEKNIQKLFSSQFGMSPIIKVCVIWA